MIFVQHRSLKAVVYFIFIWLVYKFSMMYDVLYVYVNTNHYANLDIIICMMRPPPPSPHRNTRYNRRQFWFLK